MAILGLKVDNLRIEKWQEVLFPVRFEQATSWLLQAETFAVKCICILQNKCEFL